MAAGGLIPLLWRSKHRRAQPGERPQCAIRLNPLRVKRVRRSGPLCPSRPRAFAQRPYASAELRIERFLSMRLFHPSDMLIMRPESWTVIKELLKFLTRASPKGCIDGLPMPRGCPVFAVERTRVCRSASGPWPGCRFYHLRPASPSLPPGLTRIFAALVDFWFS